jgi:hypothetical protein
MLGEHSTTEIHTQLTSYLYLVYRCAIFHCFLTQLL